MLTPKFKVGDHVKYNGDIYKITGIQKTDIIYLYNVTRVKSQFPEFEDEDTPKTAIGMGGECNMTLVDFYPPEKEKWLDEVCKFLKDNIDLEHDYPKDADELIKDLKQHMHNNK